MLWALLALAALLPPPCRAHAADEAASAPAAAASGRRRRGGGRLRAGQRPHRPRCPTGRHGVDDGLHAARHHDDRAGPGTVLWRPRTRKNMLSVLMQVMVTFSLIVVLWVIYGYSPRVHRGQRVLRRHRPADDGRHLGQRRGNILQRAHLQQGVVIRRSCSAVFQATFAGITCCLIVGVRRAHEVRRRACVHGAVVPFATRRSTWSGSGWARTRTRAREVADPR